ncbi:MAG TPA: signal recognition particle protein [Dehalococcoidia bacterium]|nr:signal recognition particle protein [Dehalococcoidia bacterium]
MFDSLSSRLTNTLAQITKKGRLTEKELDEALSEVRRSLLEADVNFRVTKSFVENIRVKAIGEKVLESLTPGQQVIKIVNEELTEILTGIEHEIKQSSQKPNVIMLVGLQGSGKTTTSSKLVMSLRKKGNDALLIAADLQRPAAIEQLITLGKQIDTPVYSEPKGATTVEKVVTNGLKEAKSKGVDFAIVDTAGRLTIDDELMNELERVKEICDPLEILLVVDAMTGQEAVNVAQGFNEKLSLTGLIMSKMDGDARGGAALSITSMSKVPIKLMGTGEKPGDFEDFYPDRLASRILGMGDVLTLIEKAQEAISVDDAKALEKKLRTSTFTFEDFLAQIQTLKKMGPMKQIFEMIPGMSHIAQKGMLNDVDDGRMQSVEAIISSMTIQERQNPEIINGSRRRRIALGSGTTPQDINQLMNQFKQMQKMMKKFATTKNPRALMGMFK